MGRETEECKHVFNMKVSFRIVLAVIVFQVPTLRDPITQEMNNLQKTILLLAISLLQFYTIMHFDCEIK